MHLSPLLRHRGRRLRRAALGLLALGGLSTVLGGGCSAPFDQPSDVNSLRVLAVTVDKPYADPGDNVTFQIEYFDGYVDPDHPNDGPRPVQILWLGGCVDPVADSYFACYAELAEVLKKIQGIAGPNPDLGALAELEAQGLLGTHETFTVPIPKDIVSRRPTPDTGPHYGIAYVFFVACAGTVGPVPPEGTGRAGSFPIGCFDDSGNRLGAESFVAGYTQVYSFEDKRPNANPEIHDLLIDGSPFQGVSPSGAGGAGGSDTSGGAGGEAALGGAGGATGAGGSGGEAGAGGACGTTAAAGGAGPSVGGGGAGASGGGTSFERTTVKRCPLTDEERRIQGCAAKDPYTECQPYEIKIDVSSSIGETDPGSSGPDGKAVTESVWVDYYATRGDFESSIRLVNGPTTGFNDDLGTRWIPPSEPGLVTIWAVVHDSRGGASVISRQLLVRCDANAECSAKGLVCDTTTGACVTCVADPDCGDESRFVCLDHTCLPSCSSNEDCLDGVCRARHCVRCESNADCSEKRPICDHASGNCIACPSN